MWAAWRALKDRAKRRKIPFSITLLQFRKFALETNYLNRTGLGKHCLTVDRKNNLKGYTPRNIQALTREENVIKQAKRDAIRMKAGFAWKEK